MTGLDADRVALAPAQPTVAEDVAFKARALAQAHPLSGVALTYRAELIVRERLDQPVPELADWAASAFLVGYCVRRVEETQAGQPVSSSPSPARILQEDVVAIVKRFSNGEAIGLLPDAIVVDVLDRVIGSEVDKRNEHVREHLDAGQWNDFEEYVAWWVLHGWAARVAERPRSGDDVTCAS